LDSIVARALLVADFIDSIDPKRTLQFTQASEIDVVACPSLAGRRRVEDGGVVRALGREISRLQNPRVAQSNCS
jgi:hypothetical protein